MTAAPKNVTAADIAAALTTRWPAEKALTIREAPQGSDRQGRRLDMLVFQLWRSQGLTIDGVEIKVSASDARKEFRTPDKADWWFERVDRFWLATNTDTYRLVKDEIPDTWGVLVVDSKGVAKAVEKPERNKDRTAIAWPTMVGLLRAAAGAGANSLFAAEQRGRMLEREAIKANDGRVPRNRSADEWHEDQYNRIVERCRAFRDATGISIEHGLNFERFAEIGPLIHEVDRLRRNASTGFVFSSDVMRRSGQRLIEAAEEYDALEQRIRGDINTIKAAQ